jgi:GT2 family glycosyltransferase
VLYIIVPTYGRVQLTKLFIESVYKLNLVNFQIYLIDDHPEKLTFNEFNNYDNIIILSSSIELWWVHSINLGIDHLLNDSCVKDSDIVIFANNDVVISVDNYFVLEKELHGDSNQIIHPRTFNLDGKEVSSGAKILSLFPYITTHPKNFTKIKYEIDMGTARFLCMTGSTLKSVGFICNDLKQYLGDNYFTLKAKKKFQIKTYIIKDSRCILNDECCVSGYKNIQSFDQLWHSFYSVSSPNNIKYRYIFFKYFFNKYVAVCIVFSMTINSIIKYMLSSLRRFMTGLT